MKQKIKLKGILHIYLIWPFILNILFLAAVLNVLHLDRKAGMVLAAYWCAYLLITAAIAFLGRKRIHYDLVQYASGYGKMQKHLLKKLSVPYGILSKDGQLLWGNDEFLEVIQSKKAARKNISNIFPEIAYEKLPKNEDAKIVHVQAGEQYYRGVLQMMVDESVFMEESIDEFNRLIDHDHVIALCLYEETEIINLERAKAAENLVAGLLYIDNYDELIDSIDEARQPLIAALIERKINKYMTGIHAISKKLEKDKFFFVFKQKHLEHMKEKRFSILEDIRSIDLGNDQNASISVGIGIGKDAFSERYEYARQAINLALGRGGDQVVLKEKDQVEFFGGTRVQSDRNTRVKARVKAHVLKDLIESKDKVIVMGHTIGDTDSFGASVGIYRIAKTLNRKVYVVLGEATSSIKPIYDRFLGQDIEGDMIISGSEAMEIVDEHTLLVIVDVNRGSLTECPELIDKTQSVVVIDHHRQAGDAIGKAVLFYIEPYASSACEMVAEISQYIGDDLRLTAAEADALYAGIMIDTNYFSNKIGVRTFEAMAYLRRCGADAVRLRKAFRDNLDEYKIKAAAIQNTELYLEQYAIAENTADNVNNPTIIGAKISNSLLDIHGVKASFVLTGYKGKIYVSARAIDEVNVQAMMEKLGGGGHINMAGAQFTDMNMEAAKDLIKQTIDEMIDYGKA